ncbi:hypothetical protein J4864_09320 [Prevotella multiformis]|uniref:hypothetical protein n=1 Tax=Prevotella multiformis TaxID=282402 RepID=UPI001BAA980D|nr:hypothetical protein [Prevotella multiformis]QUB71360.1 hypothetical protein J4864_09320 [Prevotella multiformis]
MFLLNESLRFFRESYAESIRAFNGRTNLFLFIWPFRFFCISLQRKGEEAGEKAIRTDRTTAIYRPAAARRRIPMPLTSLQLTSS